MPLSNTSVVAVYYQHPAEVIRYRVPFADALAANDDSIVSWSVEADPGITLSSALLDNTTGEISFEVASGLDTYSYLVAAQITTDDGQVERQSIAVRFRGQVLTGPKVGGGSISIATGSIYLDDARVLLDSSYWVSQ